jgi:AcrR family transcriptional regulator
VTTDRRSELLAAAIDHVAAHGLTDLSLRTLAAELGTSHRMLSHHFGSKDGLWLAIVREVERRQRDAMAELAEQQADSGADLMRQWWQHISDPSLWPNERLFFEVYSQGLLGRSPAAELLEGIVDSWVAPAADLLVDMGVDADEAASLARLGLAVTRGLLLDLLATGDREAVDAAMEQWISLNADRLPPGAGPGEPPRAPTSRGRGRAARAAR